MKDNLLPKTPEPEVDYEGINRSYRKQLKKIKMFNIIGTIIAIILLIIIFLIMIRYREEHPEKFVDQSYIEECVNISDDGLIYFVAKIKRTEIAPPMLTDKRVNSSSSTTIYIVDYDGHVFSTDFRPELLLLEDGSYIKVYFDTKYFDKQYIKISRYETNGTLEAEYYMNNDNG